MGEGVAPSARAALAIEWEAKTAVDVGESTSGAGGVGVAKLGRTTAPSRSSRIFLERDIFVTYPKHSKWPIQNIRAVHSK